MKSQNHQNIEEIEDPIEVFECPHCGSRVLEVETILPVRQTFLYAWNNSEDSESEDPEDLVYEYRGFDRHEGDVLDSIRDNQGNALEETLICSYCGTDFGMDWTYLRKEGAVKVIAHKDYKKWLQGEKLKY